MNRSLLFALLSASFFSSCGQAALSPVNNQRTMSQKKETATFGAGCFWCVEAVFQRLQGVDTVVSGYANGTSKSPTYAEICTGNTGHAEVCQISFDPSVISFEELCHVFYLTHDPTTLNRQGGDKGTQYRSAIFYTNDEQKQTAEKVKHELDSSNIFIGKPIVTQIAKLEVFYPAEDYHQNYFNQNGNSNPYCQYVIVPKLEKFRDTFEKKVKSGM